MDKVVLITGAARGIGREISLAFGREGCRVVVNYLKSEEAAKKTVREITKQGGRAMTLQADISKPVQVNHMFAQTIKEWGRLDVLINNAGTAHNKLLLKMSVKEWQDVLDVNITGAFLCIRSAAGLMIKNKGGSIINIASIVGLRGSIGCANYAAAKGGLIALTKSAAKELGRFNIRINAVLPGFHLTDMGREVWDKRADAIRAEHTLGRTTDIKELAKFVVSLSQLETVSGQIFNLDSRIL